MKPINPAGPSDDDITWNKPIIKLATPEAPKAMKNGKRYFKFTPNKAGSVMPSIADAPADEASARILALPFAKK